MDVSSLNTLRLQRRFQTAGTCITNSTTVPANTPQARALTPYLEKPITTPMMTRFQMMGANAGRVK